MLVFRADYELATTYLSSYMQMVVDRARMLGYNVIDLHGADATQTSFMTALEQNDPLLVIAGGHGNELRFHGQNGEEILSACVNDEVMSRREAIFNSCSVGVELGPSMVDKTALWFAGWRADYIFVYDETAAVLEDRYAQPFMECIIQPALTRLEGGGPSIVYQQTINKFNQWLSEWWNSQDPVAQEIITYLTHDRDNFMVTGVYAPIVEAVLNPVVLAGSLILSHYILGFP